MTAAGTVDMHILGFDPREVFVPVVPVGLLVEIVVVGLVLCFPAAVVWLRGGGGPADVVVVMVWWA